jgi:UDP-N-acetylmuramyl tripeptide synthase
MLLCRVLGADDRALAQGLMAFSGDVGVNPGRGNLFEKNGVRVFLDFAHNEHGIRAVSDTVRAFQARRLLVLIGQAGDRTDQEIANLVNAACNLNPSRLLVCDLPGYERGRQPGKVAEMIRDYALEEGLPEQAVTLFGNPLDGVRQALKEAVKGDCVVLLAPSQRDEVLALIRSFVEGR